MFFLFLLGCGLLILQSTIFHYVPLWLLKIDGLLLLIIYISLYRNGLSSILVIFSLGLLVDAFAGSALGMHALMYVVLFGLIRLISNNLVIKNTRHQMILIFLATLFVSVGLLSLNLVFMGGVGGLILWHHFGIALLQSLLTSLLSPPFFILYSRFDRMLGLQKVR